MNFLAHLLTGDSGDEMLTGSFAGDFCHGSIGKQRAVLQPGIRLHRLVDGFAEDHPSFSEVRARLRSRLGLYAPVGADMLIDHRLAAGWSKWVSGESLAQFADRSGARLLGRSEWLPERAVRVARMMVSGRWLESYAEREGMRIALERMSGRTRGEVDLASALAVLDGQKEELFASIDEFLDDLFRAERLLSAGMRAGLAGRNVP